jgi:hypothetical protein
MLSRRDADDDDSRSTISGRDTAYNNEPNRKDYCGSIIIDAFSFLRASDEAAAPLGTLQAGYFIDAECGW